jgi:phage terminase large subunit
LTVSLDIPKKCYDVLFGGSARFRVLYGGRGSGKSWSIAKALLIKGIQKKTRILCAREFQTSIQDSVKKLLDDQIEWLGIRHFYTSTQNSIIGRNGTEFFFKGLHHNANEIKSTEGLDFAWVEEAEKVSEESWSFLIPTIRKEESEIWVSFNPYKLSDPTYQRLIVSERPDILKAHVNYDANPWFPEVLKTEMEFDRATNPDRYAWVWAGNPLMITNAQIFAGKFFIDTCPTPEPDERLFFGLDFGFAQDPTALVRCFIRDDTLYIDKEAGGHGIENDEIIQLFKSVEKSELGPCYADSSRPETISYLKAQGLGVVKCDKWSGSVEDGIAYLRNFKKIIVDPSCKHIAEEFFLYSYKQDRQTGEILPIILDKNNHYLDALRYALTKKIKNKKEFCFA